MIDPVVHSTISPSYLKQLILCNRSLPRDVEAVDDTNQAALTGTIQHAQLNYLLADYFGLAKEEVDISSLTEDEINEVQEVFNKVLDEYKFLRKKHSRIDVKLEEKIDLNSFLPTPSWGYVDICFIAHKSKTNSSGIYDNTLISVLDAKFGRIEVLTQDKDKTPNAQLTAYWCGIYDQIKASHNVTRARLTILQPKLNNYPVLSCKPNLLLDYMNNIIAPAAFNALEENGKYNPSLSNCKYCKNSKHCKFHNIMAMAQLQMLENPDMLSDEYIEQYVLPNITNLKKYCDNIWDYAVKKAEQQNKKWKGFVLGTSRPSRVYTDDESVKQLAREKHINGLIVESVLTPAQAEKLLGKNTFGELLGDLVTYKPGKTTLVPDAPIKKASKQTLKNDFKKENK